MKEFNVFFSDSKWIIHKLIIQIKIYNNFYMIFRLIKLNQPESAIKLIKWNRGNLEISQKWHRNMNTFEKSRKVHWIISEHQTYTELWYQK